MTLLLPVPLYKKSSRSYDFSVHFFKPQTQSQIQYLTCVGQDNARLQTWFKVKLFPLGMWPPRSRCRQEASVWGKSCARLFSCSCLADIPPPGCLLWFLIAPESEGHRKVLSWLAVLSAGSKLSGSGRGLKSMLPFLSILWVLQRALLPTPSPPATKRKHRLATLQLPCPGWLQLYSTGAWPRVFISP